MAELLEWSITGSRSNVPPVGSGGCLLENSRPKSFPISYQDGPTLPPTRLSRGYLLQPHKVPMRFLNTTSNNKIQANHGLKKSSIFDCIVSVVLFT